MWSRVNWLRSMGWCLWENGSRVRWMVICWGDSGSQPMNNGSRMRWTVIGWTGSGYQPMNYGNKVKWTVIGWEDSGGQPMKNGSKVKWIVIGWGGNGSQPMGVDSCESCACLSTTFVGVVVCGSVLFALSNGIKRLKYWMLILFLMPVDWFYYWRNIDDYCVILYIHELTFPILKIWSQIWKCSSYSTTVVLL